MIESSTPPDVAAKLAERIEAIPISQVYREFGEWVNKCSLYITPAERDLIVSRLRAPAPASLLRAADVQQFYSCLSG